MKIWSYYGVREPKYLMIFSWLALVGLMFAIGASWRVSLIHENPQLEYFVWLGYSLIASAFIAFAAVKLKSILLIILSLFVLLSMPIIHVVNTPVFG